MVQTFGLAKMGRVIVSAEKGGEHRGSALLQGKISMSAPNFVKWPHGELRGGGRNSQGRHAPPARLLPEFGVEM